MFSMKQTKTDVHKAGAQLAFSAEQIRFNVTAGRLKLLSSAQVEDNKSTRTGSAKLKVRLCIELAVGKNLKISQNFFMTCANKVMRCYNTL